MPEPCWAPSSKREEAHAPWRPAECPPVLARWECQDPVDRALCALCGTGAQAPPGASPGPEHPATGPIHCPSVCPSSKHLFRACERQSVPPRDAPLPSSQGPAAARLAGPCGPLHLLQQCQLAEKLVGAVLGQEVGPLLAGLGVGAVEVLEEAGLGQGGRNSVLALLVWQRQPVAPGQPPGEALQGKPGRAGGGTGAGGGPRPAPGPGPFRVTQLEPQSKALPPAAMLAGGHLLVT